MKSFPSAASRQFSRCKSSASHANHIRNGALDCVDCHAAGEPARVVVGGLPHIPGASVMEKRDFVMAHHDDLRKLLLLEPRGYPCQNANFIVPPCDSKALFGFIIAEQGKIYPAMSGHNAICVVTALVETGRIPMKAAKTTFALEAPAGLIEVVAECDLDRGKVTQVTLRNQPAFCRPQDMDVLIDVPHVGEVMVDVAYGGMHYAIVDAQTIGLSLDPSNGREVCRIGEMIKIAAKEQHPVNHPCFDYPGCDILVFRDGKHENRDGAIHAKNVVVMSNGTLDWERPETWTGMIDRSPCGTGTSAVMASLHARGELAIGQDFFHSGILGTQFRGRLEREDTLIPRDGGEAVRAVVPTISGSAWITQYARVICDPTDPFPSGYTVADIW